MFDTYFGIALSTLITTISSIPPNIVTDYSYFIHLSCYLNIAKSFNISRCGWIEKIHHLIVITTCLIILNSNSNYSKDFYTQYNVVQIQNFSTIFLNLRRVIKHSYIDYWFIVTFFVFRLRFNYMLYTNKISFDEICIQNDYVTTNLCINFYNISMYLLSMMNNYWFILILLKIKKKYL